MTSGAGSSRQGSRGGVDGKVPGGRPAGGKAARLLVLSAALAIVIVGFAAGSIGFLFAMIESGGDQLKVVTLAVSFLFLTVGLGSVLAWQAWGAVRGRPSRPFHPRLIWPWVVPVRPYSEPAPEELRRKWREGHERRKKEREQAQAGGSDEPPDAES